MSKVLVIKGADFSASALDTVEFDVVHCTEITLDRSTLSLDTIGATATLIPTVRPSDCEEGVFWTSSNTNCCTVNQSGVITVVGVGTTTITARCGSYSATCAVTVEILASVARVKQANTKPANATNHYTDFEAFAPTDTNWCLDMMTMFKYQEAADELIVGYSLVTFADSVASLPTWADSTNGFVSRCKNAGMTNYPTPIPLPTGCTKVRTHTPLSGYGSRILWFKKTVPSGSGTGSDNEKKGFYVAYRDLAVSHANYEWAYNSGETFDVPEGYDSCVVVWKSGSEVTNFHSLTYTDVDKFNLYFS